MQIYAFRTKNPLWHTRFFSKPAATCSCGKTDTAPQASACGAVYKNGYRALFSIGSHTPLLAGKAAVVVVATLRVVLGGSEQFGCLGGILLLN